MSAQSYMNQILIYSQITVSVLLIAVILLQQKEGGLLKSSTGFYGTLRGLEKKIFWFTAFLGFCFIVLALLNLVI